MYRCTPGVAYIYITLFYVYDISILRNIYWYDMYEICFKYLAIDTTVVVLTIIILIVESTTGLFAEDTMHCYLVLKIIISHKTFYLQPVCGVK